MKIATKLTKRVADFVNEQYIRNFHPDESDYLHFDSEMKPTPCMFSELFKGYTHVSEQEFIDMVTAELAGKTDQVEPFNPQPHYDNSKGSLYKIATERNWNAYTFDVVKRLDRGGKKDSLRQEIEKSIDVLKIWLNELPE